MEYCGYSGGLATGASDVLVQTLGYVRRNGCSYKFENLFVRVLVLRALFSGVYTRAPDFWNLPSDLHVNATILVSKVRQGLHHLQ